MELSSEIVLGREVDGLANREGHDMAISLYSKKSTDNQSERGFTLAELLIVVAIIGVLTAVAIPVFTSQLEKSREATDLANVRSAFADFMTQIIDGKEDTCEVLISPLKQKVDDWTLDVNTLDIGGIPSSKWIDNPSANGSCKISYDRKSDTVTITWGSEGGLPYYVGRRATEEELSEYNSVNGVGIGGPGMYYGELVVNDNYYYSDTNKPAQVGVIYYSRDYGEYYKTDGTKWYYTNGAGKEWKIKP